ncbi:MAG TPA: DUF6351 family protein [Gaiella sp.]|uniref:DUF6351 family protein n=1 Tax=Gaiella sp. TaxID=2663207 RepID=UPI002D7F7467|nr:DUF6351 family protein [Gaiella sp.]HET9287592.1 DUF6351 family protein [Gaiella sp.]
MRRGLALSIAVAAVAALLATGLATAATGPPAGNQGQLQVRVVSSPPALVSGGDARVEVTVPPSVPFSAVEITVDGNDVSGAFAPDSEGGHQLEGVVTGLPLGESALRASVPGPGNARPNRVELRLVNHSLDGPMFSGPRQEVFLCATAGNAANAALPPIPPSETCTTPTLTGYFYRSAGGWSPYTPGTSPADAVPVPPYGSPFVVVWERGVIDRFIYSIAVPVPAPQAAGGPLDLTRWNRALIYKFQGGVGIGHYQGNPSRGEMLYEPGLAKGYAIAYSTGNRTSTHYNLQLGGEAAIMVKDRFVSAYAEPEYTVGVGASGGAIQQYVYGQNHPGLIDAGIPQYSYPDMVTQTIHVGDCELLEHWMDRQVLASPASMWRSWTNRTLLEGMSSSPVVPNPYAAVMPYMPTPGSTECINGWRGLSPLALNPLFGTAPGVTPEQQAAVEWTHWADLVNIYGRDETGFARSPWDNRGVQYGLSALRSGSITPEQFLDLNASVGSWKESKDMVQEGCPYIAALCGNPANVDVWSARNMNLSADGGATPAARRVGNRQAQYAAYRSGMVFRGKIEIPLIDWRHYLEPLLDMHNSHQSFAARQRMLDFDGDASNQVIWFTDARPAGPQSDQTPMALDVIDEWMTNIAAHPERSVAANKPSGAVDRCFTTNGSPLASGDGVWAGILDDRPQGACAQAFPVFGTSRTVAGGPITGAVFACERQPVERAAAQGLYAPWVPGTSDIARLKQIFPDGVCDYTKGDAGLPPELNAKGR